MEYGLASSVSDQVAGEVFPLVEFRQRRLDTPRIRGPFQPKYEEKLVHPVNGEVPPVKGKPWKLPHYANRGKTTSSGEEPASARSCFSTVRTALGKLRITGLLVRFDVARSFPQFLWPLLLQPTILTSERGSRFGIRKAPNHVPPPHLPDDPKNSCSLVGGLIGFDYSSQGGQRKSDPKLIWGMSAKIILS